MVSGAEPVAADPEQALAQVLDRVAAGERLKDAVAAVAEESGLVKRELYAAALEVRAAATSG